MTVVVSFLCGAPPIKAQAVEIAPFAGYRFGGDVFELVSGHAVDQDGAPAFGVVVDVPLSHGLQFEAFVTHQSADILAPRVPSGPPARWRIVFDHFQAGGLQEFGNGPVRPFLTGVFGLSRYAAAGDDEIRFSIGAGGGVKVFPWSAVGLRLDARFFATFVDVDGQFVACAPGACFLNLYTNVVWQSEFTAGMVIRLQ